MLNRWEDSEFVLHVKSCSPSGDISRGKVTRDAKEINSSGEKRGVGWLDGLGAKGGGGGGEVRTGWPHIWLSAAAE